jgi:hypothetical protein
MGSLFSPSPPPPPPMPALPAPDPEAEARQARLKALERRRRGLIGTVATGPRGVLQPPGAAGAAGKTRLGE